MQQSELCRLIASWLPGQPVSLPVSLSVRAYLIALRRRPSPSAEQLKALQHLIRLSNGSAEQPTLRKSHPWPVWFDTAGAKPCYHLYDPATGEVMETRDVPTNGTEAKQLYPDPSRSTVGERAELEAYYGIKPGA